MATCLSYASSANVIETMLSSGFPAKEVDRVVGVSPRRVQSALRLMLGLEIRDALPSLAPGNHF